MRVHARGVAPRARAAGSRSAATATRIKIANTSFTKLPSLKKRGSTSERQRSSSKLHSHRLVVHKRDGRRRACAPISLVNGPETRVDTGSLHIQQWRHRDVRIRDATHCGCSRCQRSGAPHYHDARGRVIRTSENVWAGAARASDLAWSLVKSTPSVSPIEPPASAVVCAGARTAYRQPRSPSPWSAVGIARRRVPSSVIDRDRGASASTSTGDNDLQIKVRCRRGD